MPQDLQTKTDANRRGDVEGQPTANFRLVCIEGPDKGKRFSMPGASAARVLVGQSPVCALRLVDPLVSRRHAVLDVQGARLHISDLGSHNGTYANDVAVVEAFLWGGETLRLGDTLFNVELDDAVMTAKVSDRTRFGRLVGESVEMRTLYPFFEQLATSNLPVLIEGDTGTGKELLAEALHEEGPRAAGPFVVFDAAQVAAPLLDRTLFGDEATGKEGVFEQADRGTVLLDEVGELEPSVQRKLLRVLERSEVLRLGSEVPRRVQVRVIATTCLDLDKLVQDGVFREDLYYRLVVSRVELPPLRRRTGDVAVLVRHFWRELGGVDEPSPALLAQLARQTWPGNVRELRNRVARTVAFGEASLAPSEPAAAAVVEASAPIDEPAAPTASAAAVFDRFLAEDLPLARAREILVNEFERAYVDKVLAANGGNVAKAAAASGLARRYFQLLRAKRRLSG